MSQHPLDLREVLSVILTAVRGDEKGECWTIRKWLDDRDIFNDDLQGSDRLIEEVCKAAIQDASTPSGWQAMEAQYGPAFSNYPVPETIVMDESFREPYCQGYRHALHDVARGRVAPPAQTTAPGVEGK
jgi:hypothetical protein